MLEIQETFVNETAGCQIGSSSWYEPYTDDRGALFRDMQREYGRCLSRVYVDRHVVGAQPFTAFGVTVPQLRETVACGWVFQRRERYEDTGDLYARTVWVQLRERADETYDPDVREV